MCALLQSIIDTITAKITRGKESTGNNIYFSIEMGSIGETMPETIKPGNVTSNAGSGEETRLKVLDGIDQIPELPLACWKGHEERVENCKKFFQMKYNSSPTFYCRVPGRVNLIGEHIDYCGFGVFPMALEHDVLILGRTVASPEALGDRSILRLTNIDNSRFEDYECRVADIRTILQNRKQGSAPNWYLYYLCGVLGTLENLGKVEGKNVYLTEICVDGKVPPSAGLSSSSALVCAAALATLVAYEGKLGRKEMASICAKSEHYIGTEGGGMDQAIAFMGEAGTAQLIEFVPRLHGEKVKLPENAVFVIANSLAESNKAATSNYNVRVAECRTATWILAKASGLPNYLELNTLKSLQQELGLSLREMSNLVSKHLHEEPYTPKEIAEILGMRLNELTSKPLMVKISVGDETPLKLNQRAKHVFEEAERVHEFRRICEAEIDEKSAQLGRLMNASHASLRDLYDCTHPNVEELIQLSQPFSFGVRQTGAGWGGCIVALLEPDRVQGYLSSLQNNYYKKKFGLLNTDNCVFVTQPGSGANILLSEL